jgi:hypothetical protein
MKRIFVLLLLTFVMSMPEMVSAKDYEFSEIETFFHEYSRIESNWSNGKLKRGEDLYGMDDEKIGYMYRVYTIDVQQGYILYLDEFGIVEAAFEGEDSARNIDGKVYYILPSRFLSKKEYYQMLDDNEVDSQDVWNLHNNEDIINIFGGGTGLSVTGDPYDPENLIFSNVNYTINTSHVINLTSNYASYSTSMSGKYYVDGVPDYNNFPDSPINNGCGPTAAAMMIAYYDNEKYNGFTEIEGICWWQKFPDIHSDDDDLVDELIVEMSDYLGNCSDASGNNTLEHNQCHGVSTAQLAAGLENFLDDEGYDEWNTVVNSFDVDRAGYQRLISTGNPSVIFINDHPTYAPGDAGHFVLGMGHYAAYMSQPGVIIYDNWSTTGREIYLSYDVVALYTFLYND